MVLTPECSHAQTPTPTPVPTPATEKALSAPIISVSGILTDSGYGGYATVSVVSTAAFVNYTTNKNIPSCVTASPKPPEGFILSSTAEVRELTS